MNYKRRQVKRHGRVHEAPEKRTYRSVHASERPTVVVKSAALQEQEKAHAAHIAALYKEKEAAAAAGATKAFHQRNINKTVSAWNASRQIGVKRHYFDLHGMGAEYAVGYAVELVRAAEDRRARLQFETGRGMHSKDGVPVIKPALIERLRQLGNCSVREDEHNPGVLVVELR